MTREERDEAIEYIKKYRELDAKMYTVPSRNFTIISKGLVNKYLGYWDMAIKALEQEPCKDCIGREEAIKCLECDFDITGRANMEVVVNYINSAHDKIMNLPSVQQEPKTDILDKIRAEILEDCGYSKDYVGAFTYSTIKVATVLQILDKYKAESEDKG